MVARLTNLLTRLGQKDLDRPFIAPSLLAADFTDLKTELKRVESADLLHLDVMDGVFVPNISFGPLVIDAVSRVTKLPLDVHLMVQNPEIMIGDLAKMKVQAITISFESGGHLHRHITQIKKSGCLAGIALNPGTSFESVVALLPFVDLVLVMSVNPGFGGQSFIPEVLPKIRMLHNYRKDHDKHFFISVDGGVNEKNAGVIVQAGADILVSGSAVFNQKDATLAIDNIRKNGKSRL